MGHEFLKGTVRLFSEKETLIHHVENKLDGGFESELFEAAINNLLDAYNPLRFNNFAYASRELVRHILYRLAPDDEVLNCVWYRNEMDVERGITRAQRIAYAIRGGLTEQYVQDTLCIDTVTTQKKIKQVVTNLSKHTHIEPDTFDIGPEKQDEYVSEALQSVADFFDIIRESRNGLSEALVDQIDAELLTRVVSETVYEIDEVASHYNIDEVYIGEIEVDSISSSEIHLEVFGSIGAELQYGSDGDMRRGDGFRTRQSFPFSCSLRSPVTEPGEFPDGPENFSVSNDEFWEQPE